MTNKHIIIAKSLVRTVGWYLEDNNQVAVSLAQLYLASKKMVRLATLQSLANKPHFKTKSSKNHWKRLSKAERQSLKNQSIKTCLRHKRIKKIHQSTQQKPSLVMKISVPQLSHQLSWFENRVIFPIMMITAQWLHNLQD